MKWYQIILLILNVLALLYITLVIVISEHESRRLIKLEKSHEEHVCNYCEMQYTLYDFDILFKYCPFCGRKLTLHKDHPDYVEYYGCSFEEKQEHDNIQEDS